MEIIITLLHRRLKSPKMLLLLACLICTLNPGIAFGQNIPDTDPEMKGVQHITAPVKVDGRVVFYVGGLSSFTADKRAAAISRRISEAASDPSVSPDSVIIVAEKDRDMVYAGSKFIMSVYDIDASTEKISRGMLAELAQKMTAQAIELHRNERSRPVLIKKALHALGAAVLLVIILYLLLWLIRRLNTGLQTRIKARIESVENISFNLIRSKQLWRLLDILFRTLKIALIFVVVAVFLEYILSLFPWTNNLASYTLDLFLDPVIKLGKGLLSFLPSLAFLVVIYFITRYLLKLTKLLFSGIEQGGISIQGFESDWALPTYKILRVLVIAFAVIIAFPYIPGSDSNAFKGVTVFLGILFSLGSSSFISNLIAGYSMTYRSAFKKGDRIQVDGQVGFVEEQRLLVTRLRSLKNEEIIIPNSTLLNSNIINYSSRTKDLGLILHTTVGIGYETPWRQVDAMLKQAAYRTEGLLQEPPPFVLKQSLGDFAVNYEINAYCNDANKMPLLYTALHQNILDVFNENNVQIMTPAYEGDPEIPKVVPKDQWNTPLANENLQ